MHKSERIFSAIIFSLLVFLLTLPFLNNLNFGIIPATSAFLPGVIALFILGLTSLACLPLIKNGQSLKISYSIIFIAIFCIVLALQFSQFTTSHYNYIAPYLTTISVLLFISIASIILQNTNLNQQFVLNAVRIGIIISCYYQVISCALTMLKIHFSYPLMLYGFTSPFIMNWMPFVSNGVLGGGFGQHNLLADFLTWGVIANILQFKSSKLRTILFSINLCLFATFIALAQSRTAYFYPVVLGLYLLAIYKYLPENQNKSQIMRKLLFSIIVISIALASFNIWQKHQLNNNSIVQISSQNISNGGTENISALAPTSLNNKLSIRGEDNKRLASHERIYMWGKAWMMFIDHPILGVGWGKFFTNLGSTKQLSFIHGGMEEIVIITNCHNLILQLLATTGIIGTVIILGLIIYSLRNLFRQRLEQQFLVFGITLIVLTHSMFEYPLFNVEILAPVLLLNCYLDSNKLVLKIKSNLFIKICCTTCIVVGLWQTIISAKNYLLLSQAIKPNNYVAGNQVNNIVNLYFATYTNLYWDDSADFIVSQYLLYDVRAPQNQKYFDFTYDILNRSANYSPNPSFVLRLALMDTVLGNHQKAQQEINKLLQDYVGFNDEFRNVLLDIGKGNPKITNDLKKLIPES